MKKAIVTGASGFIGSAFVQFLVNHGIDVLAVGRKFPDDMQCLTRNRLSGSTYLSLNLEEISDLATYIVQEAWVPGDDCVFINLAWGGVSQLSDMDVEAQLANVYQSVNAVEVAKELGCTKFLQIGTMEEAFTEAYLNLNHRLDSQFNRHVIYSVAKSVAKRAVTLRAKMLGLDLIYVLHSHVMGPGDDKDSFLQITLEKLIRGEDLIFSSGEQCFDVISLEDCAQGYFLICQSGRPGETYWVGSGDPRPLREYVERMYALFPSGKTMQFGALGYDDVHLTPETFAIDKLVMDTGFEPQMSYEDTVRELYQYVIADWKVEKNVG